MSKRNISVILSIFFSILYKDLKAGGGSGAAATQLPLLIPVRGVQELLNNIHHGL